ncbi:YraN family protein [Massilia sp. YIM B02769]|jgi:putative endonuclease|uniref:YraN family protein n=1 Tax=unclassified Massilia TaxID=2609279 RepID=UPI0025B662FF|nr:MULTISPECIES: YraN family protein [unclassified Massilia]MDN4056802.1 YraN family protein [Massilia sp. YIM B02769]
MPAPRLSQKQTQGRDWEQTALRYLKRQGLSFIEANFTCKGGEIDLIMRDGDTIVFVEVRQRADSKHGGAAASITPAKIRRLVRAAQVYLLRFPRLPPCRFDVIAIDGEELTWLRNAIEA